MRPALLLTTVALVASGCTGDTAPVPTAPSPAATTEEATHETPKEAQIYAAVIRHLVSNDHTFGRGRFSYKVIFVLDGPRNDAGRPRGDVFAGSPRPFPADVVAGIHEDLSGDSPPLRFVGDGSDALRGGKRLGEVKQGGALIVLGPIGRKKGRVEVPNTFWCGGKCSQWLTFVVSERNGQWVVKGTTGRVTMS